MRMTTRVVGTIVLLSVIGEVAKSQEGTWMFSGSVGTATFALQQVNDDLENDVQGWNTAGIPISPFPPLKSALLASGTVSFRYDRDFDVSLSVIYASKQVETSYKDADQLLLLKRSVGSTDLMMGLAYHPPPAIYFVDWYFEVNVGYIFARAGSDAFGTKTKQTDSTQTVTTLDTQGSFRKTKLIAAGGVGANVKILESVAIKLQAKYRVATLGKLDGDVTRLGDTQPQTTSIEFDYSGFLFSLGVGIEL